MKDAGVHHPDTIVYHAGNNLELESVLDLYRASTLGERRPVDDTQCMEAMIRNASLVITAWDGKLLVGLARALTDFVYVTYLADLAVRVSHQHHGIGRELIRRTQAAATTAQIVLLAAPAAEAYYPRVGFDHHPQAWVLPPGNRVR